MNDSHTVNGLGFRPYMAPACCTKSKELVERFAAAFGLDVRLQRDFTPVDFCDEYTLQLRLPNGEALQSYPENHWWCVPEIARGCSEVRLLPAYIELLSRIIGTRLILRNDDGDYGRRVLDGVFAETVEELELKLTAMGY
jgi:hypothetical protein